ncbi:POK9 protein, partial [Cnemophilus loriae]|nr:POK9 protein [Cnemophilus loriae]
SGSLGLNLATSVDVTFIDDKPQKIPTGVYGPLIINGQAEGALLLSRSSAGIKGLFVVPRVIDSDYTGEIAIVAHTSFYPLLVPRGSQIAQLVPMMQLTCSMAPIQSHNQSDKGFGSTGGVALLTLALKECPIVQAVFRHSPQQEMRMTVLLDPGSDLTI